MSQWLRQSTAATVKFGPFVDKTDGVALETGLATAMDNATTGIRVSKNGGNYADRNDATAPAYDETGDYNIVLSTTDTDTLGRLKIIFEEAATCLPVWQEFMVVPANVWDALFGADKLQVDVDEWLGTAVATPTVAGVPEVDLTHLMGVILAEGVAGRLAAAFNKLFDVETPTLVASDVMRGTNSAALAVDLLDKLGAVNEAAAAGDPSATESVMQYVKQIINILAGTAGIGTWASGAAPGNAVSLSEAIRAIYDSVLTVTIKKNATFNYYFGMVDSAGAPITGRTVTAQRVLDGATSFSGAGGTVTEVASGAYLFAALAADTNADSGLWRFSAAGADDVLFAFKGVS